MKLNSKHLIAVVGMLLLARPAAAHFPWLDIGQDGKAIYFFGESPADRTYHLPPPIAKAKVVAIATEGQRHELAVEPVETDDFIGIRSTDSVLSDTKLVSQVTYGIYRGARLQYYTLHRGGSLPTSREASQKESLPLDLNAQLVDTPKGVDVYVAWKGQALPGVEVRLYCDEGHEEGNAKTNDDGMVSFTDDQVEAGLNGIMLE